MGIVDDVKRMMGGKAPDGNAENKSEAAPDLKKGDEGAAEAPNKAQEAQGKEASQDSKAGDAGGQKPDIKPEPTEAELLREQNAELLRQIEELSKPIPQKVEKPAKKEDEPTKPAILEFLKSQEELDTIVESKDKFNELLTGVTQKAVTAATEIILRSIPALAQTEANKAVSTQLLIQDFYKANKDLIPHKNFAGRVFDELVSAEPDKDFGYILDKLGPEVRKRLGVKKVEENNLNQNRNKGGFAPGGGRAAGDAPNKPAGIKDEVAKMKRI